LSLRCRSALLGICAWMLALPAMAGEPFTVRDIRVEGLRRISEGTLFNYLPIAPGDTVDDAKLASALRAVYKAGFFKDVRFLRDGADLVISVEERPAIRSFSLTGNKEIKTEDLERVLTRNGLAEGRIFDRSVLEGIQLELTRQYHGRGRYGVKVETEVVDVGENQVTVDIVIREGETAKIRQINIVGNQTYTDEQLLDLFELSTPGLFTWASGDDQYEREKLGGDLEKLRSWYMDRGYADFRIESTQVTVSPDRRGVFITINLREGDVYTIKDVKLTGDMVVAEAELRRFVLAGPGNTFSMGAITSSSQLVQQRLGQDGYAFAEVTPYPELDRDNKQVSLTLLVEPGARVYVNRINVRGSTITTDEVYRREMRQFEGTWLSNQALDRSRLRIQRLPFVENVEHKIERVPGTEDLVDINFDVTERSAGNFQAGIGFGGTTFGGFIDLSVTHSNFFGTGNRVSLNMNSRSYSQVYSFSLTQPYWTLDGVSRTISAFYNTSDSLGQNLESFSRESYGFSTSFRWPISEYQSIGIGASLARTDIAVLVYNSSQQLYDFVTNPNHGDPYLLNNGGGTLTAGLKYDSLVFNGGWTSDTRNRAIFADRGTLRSLTGDVAIYPGDVSFWAVRASNHSLFPLPKGFVYSINAEVSLAKPYDTSADIPPDRKFYGGGADSVRGFRDSFLGPMYATSFGRSLPLGGDLRVSVQNELVLPNFLADDPLAPPKTGRFSAFVDVGNVFAKPSDFEFRDLRASFGLASTFLTPLGAMRFSFAIPFRHEDTDELEKFQFTVGTVF
jgi:outer membrane protein insertion porin family